MRQFFFTLLAGALSLSAAETIVGGPFVVNAGQKQATVVWVVKTGEATLGTTQGATDRKAPFLHAESAGFTGLKAGTTYYYNVNGRADGMGSFRTSPEPGTPFDFVVFGDTRTRHDMHQRVVDAILKYSDPQIVLHTGDLVTDGTDTGQWPTFFEIEKNLLKKAAFYPALGNHEKNSRHFYEFFQITTPWYSFDWGNAHFICINSDIGNAAASPAAKEAFWKAQTAWLEEDLQRSQKATFRFVYAHHPPFTAVSKRQGDSPHMQALVPMFEKYNVTAGWFGHDHNYQHYLKDGIHYVITGGGGAPLYDVGKPAEGITQKVTSTEHFVKIRVEGDTATATAIALDGTTIETFTMTSKK